MQGFPDIPEDAQPAPVGFSKLRYNLPTGTSIASVSPKGLFGIFMCGSPYTTLQQGIVGRSIVTDNIKNIFNQTLESQGYDVTGDPGRMFDEQEDIQRTAYAVGARVTQLRMDVCNRKSFWFGFDRGYVGEGEIEIEWTVFDLIHRKNAYKTKTKGYAKLGVPNYEGLQLIFEESFSLAAHNLGADKTFKNLVIYGDKPRKAPETIQDLDEMPLGKFNPNEAVKIQNPPLYNSKNTPPKKDWHKASVLIQAGNSHGSGFFITKDGHIVTNAHVVGNAFRVRVVTYDKKEKLAAEVLRVDRRRDVALLRLEDPLPGIKTLPIRREKPDVGDDLYAIGSPQATKLQDTMTHGIVSAHRYDRREKQWYIQGDVGTHGGNSGGPLIDEYGNIVGISVAGYDPTGFKIDTGLNLFIPIDDALKKLDISY